MSVIFYALSSHRMADLFSISLDSKEDWKQILRRNTTSQIILIMSTSGDPTTSVSSLRTLFLTLYPQFGLENKVE